MQCSVPLGQIQPLCIFRGTGMLLFTFNLTELISALHFLWNWHVLVYFQPYRAYICTAFSVERTCFGLLLTLQSLYLHCIFCGNLFWIFLNLAVIIDNSCISCSMELTCFCLLFYFSVIATLHLLWNWRAFVYFQSCSRRIDSKCARRREASRCPRSTRQM